MLNFELPNNLHDFLFQLYSQVFIRDVATILTFLTIYAFVPLLPVALRALIVKLLKRPDKVLSLRVLSRIEIPKYNDLIQVKLEGKSLDKPGIVNLELFNLRETVCPKDDVSGDESTINDKISISFGQAQVEKVIVVDKTDGLNDLNARAEGAFVTFSPKFLNKKDYIKFQVILSNYDQIRDQISLVGRIKNGKKSFQEFDYFRLRDSWVSAFILTYFYFIPVVAVLLFLLLQIDNLEKNILWVQALGSGILAFIVVLTHFSVATEAAVRTEEIQQIDSVKLSFYKKALIKLNIRRKWFLADWLYLKALVVGFGIYMLPYFLNLLYITVIALWRSTQK